MRTGLALLVIAFAQLELPVWILAMRHGRRTQVLGPGRRLICPNCETVVAVVRPKARRSAKVAA